MTITEDDSIAYIVGTEGYPAVLRLIKYNFDTNSLEGIYTISEDALGIVMFRSENSH